MRPWLTVITVVKDDPVGLGRTASSVAAQDLDGVEYLVVDSSRDPGASKTALQGAGIAAKYTWVAPEGIYSAMNAGLAQASGEYVYFANAGDELSGPEIIARVHRVASELAPGWLYGSVEIVGVDGSRVVTPDWDFDEESESAFSRGRFPCHQGTFVRTELLRGQGGFDVSYSIVADYASFLKLTKSHRPVVVEGPLATFNEGGLSTRRWHESLRQFHRARRIILAPTGRVARIERWNSLRTVAAAATYRTLWPISAALVALTWLLLVSTGVTAFESLRLTAVVVVQALGGALWWRMTLSHRSMRPAEVVGMGLALGAAASAVTGLIGLWWLPAIAGAGVWVLRQWRGGHVAPTLPWERSIVMALVAGLVPGIGAYLYAVRSYPLSWSGIWHGYHGDMPFFEALSTSMARFSPDSIFASGTSLRYHVLAYAWSGQATQAADASPFVVLVRVVPIVTLIATTLLAAAWARRLSRNPWVPSLAVLLIVCGGFVGATYGSVLNFDSPSQSWSVVWLLALALALVTTMRASHWRWLLPAIALLSFAVVSGKVSTGAVAVAGGGWLLAGAWAMRKAWRHRAAWVFALLLVAGLGAYLLFLSGSANTGGLGMWSLLDRAASVQGLNPVATPRGAVAGIVLLVLAIVPRWIGLGWLAVAPTSRATAPTLFGEGAAIAGIATVVALSGGFNDLWFALAASAPISVLSAVGAGRAAQALGVQGRLFTRLALAWGLLLACLAAGLWATGSTGIIGQGWRWSAPLVAWAGALIGAGVLSRTYTRRNAHKAGCPRLVTFGAIAVVIMVATALPSRILYPVAESFAPKQVGTRSPALFQSQMQFVESIDRDQMPAWSDTQVAAGKWLSEHARPDDLVATNLTYSTLVPALTGLQTFVSGIHYQAPYGPASDVALLLQREAQSWAFIQDPSRESVAPLCAAGVRWLWVDPRRTEARNWLPYAKAVLTLPDVTLLSLDSAHCP